jgi:hypothetical protein
LYLALQDWFDANWHIWLVYFLGSVRNQS